MIEALGDAAVLIRLGDEIDLGLNQRVHALEALLQVTAPDGILATVPAYCTLLIHYDPLRLTFTQVASWVTEQMERVEATTRSEPRRVEVPVQYGGEYGPDLEAVASSTGLSTAEVIRLHSQREYTVYMMGFTPGFPYLGTLPEPLVLPRLETPRTRVPAGTVAIAGSQTGIYPLASPGGWHLLGWTPLKLFDPASERPFLFAPGDQVKFIPVETTNEQAG
jgi:KipI family sensor histidine kinase inhibitor